MGARAPLSTRPRRGGFKCEFCGRLLGSAEGLLSHKRTLHSTALRDQERRRKTPTSSPKVAQKPVLRNTVASKAAKVAEVVKPPTKMNAKKVPLVKEKSKMPEVKDDEESDSEAEPLTQAPASVKKVNSKTDDTKNSDVDKTSKKKMYFKCPTCEKIFNVYFSALKHIQKNNCVNGKGQKMTNSSNRRPILVEHCLYCDTRYTGTHTCPRGDVDLMDYMCTGCDQSFGTMKMFDVHMPGVHSNCLESLFFATNSTEFYEWKDYMEKQTNTKYSMTGTYGSKRIYHCSYVWSKDSGNMAYLCPSVIATQEVPTGLQVHFYKDHSHDCEEYISCDKYKSIPIADLIFQTEGYPDMTDCADENDLYVQFKTLMETIVVDAAKINIDTLKKLVDKAIEMTSVITSYDDDGDFDLTSCNTIISPKTTTYQSTSDDIKTALKSIRCSQRIKRKMSAVDTSVSNKKAKLSNDETKSPVLQQNVKKLNTLSNVTVKSPVLQQKVKELDSLSNDTVKSPVLQRVKKVDSFSNETAKSPVLQQKLRKVNIISNDKIKSPILQQKVKKNNSFSLADDKDSDKILKELDNGTNKLAKNIKNKLQSQSKEETENLNDTFISPKNKIEKKIQANISGSPSFNDTYKDFIETIKKPNTIRTTKETNANKTTKETNGNKTIKETNANKTIKETNGNKTIKETNANKTIKESNTIKTNKETNKKKIKTKMGQYKPSIIPKQKEQSSYNSRRSSSGKVNEIKFEIKERENDCNILILKI